MSSTVSEEAPATAAATARQIALGRLTPEYAHEMRNVLTGIRCYLEMLGDSRSGLSSDWRLLAELNSGIDRMADLSTRLLELSRGTAATGHINTEIVRVLGLFEASGLRRRTIFDYDELDEDAGVAAGARGDLELALLTVLGRLLARQPDRLVVRTRRCGDDTEITLEAHSSPISDRREAIALEELLPVTGEFRVRATPAGIALIVSADRSRDLSESE